MRAVFRMLGVPFVAVALLIGTPLAFAGMPVGYGFSRPLFG